MSEAVLTRAPTARAKPLGGTLVSIAWRNLWRNRRRTWLTSGGIAFALFLVVFARSTQDGTFNLMIDNSTRFMSGHLQIQHPAYRDDPRVRYTIENASAVVRRVASHPDVVAVAPRAVGFALVSADERSFGAQVMGVIPAREFATFKESGLEGRYLEGQGEAFLGRALARNLSVAVGGEVVVLGTGKDGGVAAMVATVVGTFSSGQSDLDRSLIQIHLDDFTEAWGLDDEAHVIAVIIDDVQAGTEVTDALKDMIPDAVSVLEWSELVPEIQQMIEMKHVSGNMLYALLILLVTFSIVNSFIMIIFERTREIGMMKALGMGPGSIIAMLQIEAMWMSVVGIAVGVGLSGALIGVLAINGIYLGEAYGELLKQYHMPDRLYPAYSYGAAAVMALVMLVATQFAAVIPALRIRRLKVVEALRAEE
ncbi:MAG: FtsX-like permease family protein [Gammaproteobacteria bacterium]|nr:FtsX-like permease family protein [Gammaproteobacteria bacterium]